MGLKTIDTIALTGKKVLVRVDFNAPLNKETLAVTDNTRIKAALPTIKKILADGGTAILMSHLGRPKNGFEDKYSLKHIVSEIEQLLGKKIHFAADCIAPETQQQIAALGMGEVVLLENLRFYTAEEKGDNAFA